MKMAYVTVRHVECVVEEWKEDTNGISKACGAKNGGCSREDRECEYESIRWDALEVANLYAQSLRAGRSFG